MANKEFLAAAHVIKVRDGDTLIARVDLGWKISIETPIRLCGINAPELATAGGPPAQRHLEDLLPPGAEITLHSKRLDKYGRAVAFVTTSDGLDVGQRMLDAGFADAVDADMKPAPYIPQLGLVKPEPGI